MKWRNEQIYHLRQDKILTLEDQNNYFSNVISELFDQDNPKQILFSFLKNDICIGYGGLVNINWIDKNAEISFIMNTKFEHLFFYDYWYIYLKLIEDMGFKELNFNKLYTYAYDLRPKLYFVLEDSGYSKEKEINDGPIKIVIHSKLNKNL
tara:strand:- start:415 stop:867 length:453 start_codon:yes stop_codon:yes gene_type:complete